MNSKTSSFDICADRFQHAYYLRQMHSIFHLDKFLFVGSELIIYHIDMHFKFLTGEYVVTFVNLL